MWTTDERGHNETLLEQSISINECWIFLLPHTSIHCGVTAVNGLSNMGTCTPFNSGGCAGVAGTDAIGKQHMHLIESHNN